MVDHSTFGAWSSVPVTEAVALTVPEVAVIVAVLAFNFLGDGLRDAADPYG